jgi:hypothetical protein
MIESSPLSLRAPLLNFTLGSVRWSAHLAGKATNRHHNSDNSVTGRCGLKLSIVIPVHNELPSLPIILIPQIGAGPGHFVNQQADVVYGSRFHGPPYGCLYLHNYLDSKLDSLMFII